MAEPSPRPMGWQVPGRTPALAAIGVLTMVLVLLAVAGTIYRRTIGPEHYRPFRPFPAPGIETFVHDGQGDPPRARPVRAADPAIEAAKRAVVAEGIAGWPR